tara:strand:+ start:455 stop:838 length:384 start_codon:yes stop_codon:yes gene_type:complete
MNNLNQILDLKIKNLNYSYNQLSQANKNLKFFYIDKIKQIKEDIIDIECQIIYEKNNNLLDIIDIHGAKKQFVDYYLFDLILSKQNIKVITLITGKGGYVLYNLVKKFLLENCFIFKIENNNFKIFL